MSKIDDGGPAFPHPPVDSERLERLLTDGASGMSLREYFAGQIMAAFASNHEAVRMVHEASMTTECSTGDEIARLSRQWADALLSALRKEG